MNNEDYMQRALELAKQARGRTSPNPLVGAVIVKEGEIIGEGYHQAAGQAHAEINALEQAGDKAKGASKAIGYGQVGYQAARNYLGMNDPEPQADPTIHQPLQKSYDGRTPQSGDMGAGGDLTLALSKLK